MPKKKIFLSAVTGQFKACRDALRSDLAAVGADVIVQEDFIQHGGTLLEKLEDYIASCDSVIALVGNAYGWEPESTAIPKGLPVRSYTQWEYYFARGERLNGTNVASIPVHAYIASPGYLEKHPVEQSAAAAEKQKTFVEALLVSGKDRNSFESIDQLARLVLRDGFKLSNADKYTRQNLPYDSIGSLFKGRDDIITEINSRRLTENKEATAIVAKQAIHGLGGIGKTRLAVEYAWQYLSDYSACLFVSADSPENLNRNLALLCGPTILDLPEQDEQKEDLQVVAVRRWLNQNVGWLMIVDNVDTFDAVKTVEKLLPSLQSGHILITSRRTDWNDSIQTLPLDILAQEDAVAFLLNKTENYRTPTEEDESIARSLVITLGGLALAIEQAGAFLKKKRISLLEYKERWDNQEVKLRHFQPNDYPSSLAVTWETSFDQLSDEAQSLLNTLCWFSSDPIPRETIENAFASNELFSMAAIGSGGDADNYLDLEDILDELGSLSLLSWDNGNSDFSVHRLVQEITKSRLTEEEKTEYVDLAILIVTYGAPDTTVYDVQSWNVMERLRPHFEHLIKECQTIGVVEHASWPMYILGGYLREKGLLKDAETLMRRALAIDEIRLGEKHPDFAKELGSLAIILQYLGRPKEAEPIMRRALNISEAHYGIDHPDTAHQVGNLATILGENGELKEAEQLILRSIKINEKHYGKNHYVLFRDLRSLAGIFQQTDRKREAIPLMLRALEISETHFGLDHPSVAYILSGYGQLLSDLGLKADAEPLMRRALSIVESTYGNDHISIVEEASNLAKLLWQTNRNEEAETLMRHVLEILEAHFDNDHPNFVIHLSNLAMLLRDKKCFREAESLMRRSLAISQKNYDGHHPNIATRLINLSLIYEDTGRLLEAESLSRQGVEIFLRSLERTGKKHPHADTALSNYENLLRKMGNSRQKRRAIIREVRKSARIRKR